MEIPPRIMRRLDAEKRMDRFYELTLEPTLFGQWAVVRRWGRFNTDGQKREVWFDAPSPAVAFMDRLHAEKRNRGYLDMAEQSPPLTNTVECLSLAENHHR